MSDLSRIAAASLLVATVALPVMAAGDEAQRFIPDIIISSTIPANGDLNPYGVAIVPPGFPSDGTIAPGDILVSNFNNNTITTQNPGGIQGTGTTIIRLPRNGPIAPAVPAGQPGNATTFFQGSGLGLTTALGVLQRGFVLVGNVPTSGGVIQPGSLLLLDKNGNQLTLSNSSSINALLSDPWDLTIDDRFDHALVFVSNVNNPVTNSGQMQNNNGFVTRLELTISTNDVSVKSATMIANGYTVAANSAALVLGPTGLAYDPTTDTLYVASTNDNSIFAVPHAGSRTGSSGTGAPIFRDEHLRGPLGNV